MSLDELAQQQNQVGSEIERLIRNYKKDSPERKGLAYLSEKQTEASTLWERFQANDYDIKSKYDDQKDHAYFAKSYFTNIQKGYSWFVQDVTNRRLQLQNPDPKEHVASEKPMPASRMQVHAGIRHIKAAMNTLRRTLPITPQMMDSYTSCQINLRNIERLWLNIENLEQKLWVDLDDPEGHGFNEKEFQELEKQAKDAIILLQEGINHRSARQRENSIEPQVKLPTISIPNFDGNYLNWTQFHDLFHQMVHQQKLGKAQKMWYLKISLSGEAERLIHHLTLSDDNYDSAWNMLKERYDNKRLLVSALLNKLFTIPTTTTGSVASIKTLHDTTKECLYGLQNLNIPIRDWDPILLHIMIRKLDSGTHMLYEQSLTNARDLQSIEDFLKFIESHFQSLEALSNTSTKYASEERRSKKSTTSKVLVTSTSPICCILCKGDHQLFACEAFLKMNPNKRLQFIQQARHCVNCLKPGHRSNDCKSRNCIKCSKKHNTLLHLEPKQVKIPSSTAATKSGNTTQPEDKPAKINQTISLSANSDSKKRSYVLLSTAIVLLKDVYGNQIEARAILDSGSQLNFISKRLLKKLGLRSIDYAMSIEGIGQSKEQSQKRLSVEISSKTTGFITNIEVQVLSKIVSPQPSQRIDVSFWSIPGNVKLADPSFNKPGSIDILIGAELFYSTLVVGQINLASGMPVRQNTVFGWTVSGRTTNIIEQNTAHCGICSEDEALDKHIEEFWQLDEIDEQSNNYTTAENRCETLFMQTTRRDTNGRFIVRLPFKIDPSRLGESSENALRQFEWLEKRLSKNPVLKEQYLQFMKEYIELGHMEEICFAMIEEPYYFLPHHGVMKPESTTTKLRVVFNGSAKTSTNFSLNDVLATGPTIQDDVFTILLRFRLPQFVFTADLEKMYRQIQIDESDQKYQLIWWRNDPNDPLKCYKLKTVTYGTTPASYLATKSLHQLAEDIAHEYSLASKCLKKDFYVDDVMSGSDRLVEALEKQRQLIAALKTAGFNLHKWCANHPQLLKGIEPKQRAIDLNLTNDSNDSIKTMGVIWHPTSDSFAVRTTLAPQKRITKKSASSDIAHIFDPLGILGPVVMTAKIFLQDLWRLKFDWEAALPQDLTTKWKRFRESLISLEKISFPRHVFPHQHNKETQVHVFADASEDAYGAAAYMRSIGPNNIIAVRLLCSKSKVAPISKQTIARLELCAAKLAAQLLLRIKKDLNLTNEKTFLWSDSTIVLSWINAESSNYQTFVANRIAAIQRMSISEQWRHVSSTENPADLLTRGLAPDKLPNNNLWFYGPKSLHGNEILWPSPYQSRTECEQERKLKKRAACAGLTCNDANHFIQSIDHRNSYRRLQRVVAYVLRIVNKLLLARKRKIDSGFDSQTDTGTTLSVDELEKAQVEILKNIQQQGFPEDLKNIRQYGEVSNTSNIKSLAPIIDGAGILRVGGRLEASSLSYNAKHPALLPYSHPFTKLIMNDLHKEHMHAGPQTLHAITQQNFWPIKGKDIARAVVHHCVRCARAKPKLFKQLMGDLPADRVQPGRPFVNTGVDFCGPVFTHYKTRGKRSQKAYIAVFCCFASKAVHLELVSDLSTEGFLGALRRFMARRGRCKKIYCDNATNFVGARNQLTELKDLFNDSRAKEKVISECSIKGIEFQFIPPRAPHFGGLWEAAVKSAKNLLQHTLASASLTYEEMETVVIEAEAILNSRPMTPLSSDPNDLTALTPAHLLIGDSLTSAIDPLARPERASTLTRWKLVQHTKNEFWRRWSSEYLHSLQHRYKWKKRLENVKIGTMVIIKDDKLPPLKWLLGRICNVIKGKDGLVRVVDVKTSSNILRRAIHYLAPLPVETDDSNPLDSENGANEASTMKEPSKERENRNSNPPKRPRLSLGAAITSILLACLALPMTNANSTIVTPFKTNPGIFFENMGSTNIIASEWNLVAYYDMAPYWREFELLQNCSSVLNNISVSIRNRNSYANIAKQIKNILDELNQTNELLKTQTFSRQKRGALNIVGNVASALFGVLDSKYAEEMSTTIESIQQNEDHIIGLLRNHTSIIDATINIMQRNQAAIAGEFEQIQKNFHNVSSQISGIEEGMREETLAQSFSALALQTILTITNFQRTQNSILDVLTNGRLLNGRLSNQLISPRQLKNELINIRANLPPGLKLPMNLEDILKFYNLISLEGRVTTRHIIFKLRLPLLNSEEFELFKLIPVPVMIHNTTTAVRPSFPYLIVNLHRDHYYPLPESELRLCILTQPEKYMCKQRHPLYKLGSLVSSCEMRLLNRLPPNSLCQIMTMQTGPYWVQMHSPNHWIYSLETETTVNLVCENNMTQLTLQNTGILRIANDCIIRQPLITIQGHKTYPTTEKLSYIPTLNLTDIIAPSNLTSALRYNIHYTPHLHELETLKHQLQENKLEIPKLLHGHNVHHYSLGYGCLALIIAILTYLLWKLRLARRRKSRQASSLSHDLEADSTSHVGNAEAESESGTTNQPFTANFNG